VRGEQLLDLALVSRIRQVSYVDIQGRNLHGAHETRGSCHRKYQSSQRAR
jgi:hypothetical protein